MNHVRPNFESHFDIRQSRYARKAHCVIEQRLRRSDLTGRGFAVSSTRMASISLIDDARPSTRADHECADTAVDGSRPEPARDGISRLFRRLLQARRAARLDFGFPR